MDYHKNKRRKTNHFSVDNFIFNNCTYVSNNTSNTCFFSSTESENVSDSDTELATTLVKQIEDKVHLSHTFKDFLIKSYRPKHDIKIGNIFIFINLDEIIEKMNDLEHMITVAFCYAGMGHIVAMSVDKKTGKIFFRIDGGSNCYDREYHLNLYKNLDVNKQTSKQDVIFDQKEFFDIILCKFQTDNGNFDNSKFRTLTI